MRIFLRESMIVRDEQIMTRSHHKTGRVLKILQASEQTEIIDDFPQLPLSIWKGIHRSSYVRAVAACDADIFAAAALAAHETIRCSVFASAESMVAAALDATQNGCVFSPTCGFHHAHWGAAGALCVLNALPLAAREALRLPHIHRVLILDCDYHRGNGTEDILARLNDSRIAHHSLGYLYTSREQAAGYLMHLHKLADSIRTGDYDLVIYQAAMDVLIGDPAGGGLLTPAETLKRDQTVFSACHQAGTPIVWNLAGGYTLPTEGQDPVTQGHLNTWRCAAKWFAAK